MLSIRFKKIVNICIGVILANDLVDYVVAIIIEATKALKVKKQSAFIIISDDPSPPGQAKRNCDSTVRPTFKMREAKFPKIQNLKN